MELSEADCLGVMGNQKAYFVLDHTPFYVEQIEKSLHALPFICEGVALNRWEYDPDFRFGSLSELPDLMSSHPFFSVRFAVEQFRILTVSFTTTQIEVLHFFRAYRWKGNWDLPEASLLRALYLLSNKVVLGCELDFVVEEQGSLEKIVLDKSLYPLYVKDGSVAGEACFYGFQRFSCAPSPDNSYEQALIKYMACFFQGD